VFAYLPMLQVQTHLSVAGEKLGLPLSAPENNKLEIV